MSCHVKHATKSLLLNGKHWKHLDMQKLDNINTNTLDLHIRHPSVQYCILIIIITTIIHSRQNTSYSWTCKQLYVNNNNHKTHSSQIVHTVDDSQARFVYETKSSVLKKPDRQNVEH